MTKSIGLMIDPLNGYGSKILDGVSQYAQQKHDWRVAFFDRERRDLAALVSSWKGDGIICTITDEAFRDAVESRDIPIVNVSGTVANSRVPSVFSDNHEIGRMAAQHFMDRGFVHFAYVSRCDAALFSIERGDGFRQALAAAGYPLHELAADVQTGDEQLKEQLKALPRPTAVLCASDPLAAAVQEACWVGGINVPEQMAILGIGNHKQMCDLCSPTLSSVEVDMERRGYEACVLLDRLLNGEDSVPLLTKIPPAYVAERRSTDVYAFDDPNVVIALRFIHSHAHETIKVRDVVAATKVSRRSLEGQFSNLLGRTLHEEIWSAHASLAKRLLSSSDFSLQEVAVRSGFRTNSALVNWFQRNLGMTPKEFRVNNRR